MSKPALGPGPPPDPSIDPVAHVLARLAWLMDRALVIPGTRIRVGLDALLGLLPVGGDVLTGLVQAALVLIALGRYRVPPAVAARMAGNVLLDVTLGSIPLLGDAFDAAFKANTRNIRLLEPYLYRPGLAPPPPRAPAPSLIDVMPVRTPWGCLAVIAAGLLGILALVLIGFIAVVRWLIRAS